MSRTHRSPRGAWLLAGSIGAAGLYFRHALLAPSATGFGDWQFFHHMWEAARVSVVSYGEWPLWDPFHCGGITLWGNPQSQVTHPLFALSFAFGTTVALKIFVLVHAAFGFAGAYLFARSEGQTRGAAILVSAVWCGSGFFAWHISGGHSSFLPFYLMPALLLAWRRAARNLRGAVGVALIIFGALLAGATYPLPYFALVMLFDALARIIGGERVLGIFRGALVTGVLSVMVGAIRLLPIAHELAARPRNVQSRDSLSLAEFLSTLVARDHVYRWLGHEFVWAEYGAFVGWGVIGLGFVGLLATRRLGLPGRAARTAAFGFLLFAALAMGDAALFAPWSLLRSLPVFDSLRVPSRFLVVVTFYLALLAGSGADVVARAFASWRLPGFLFALRRSSTAVTCFCLIAVLLETQTALESVLDRWDGAPVPGVLLPAPAFHLVGDPYAGYASFPARNVGTPQCYEALHVVPARGLWLGDREQARLVDGSTGTLLRGVDTPSSSSFSARLSTPSRVLLNRNYTPDWVTSVGTMADSDGLLAVDLPAGAHRVRVHYVPAHASIAVASTAVGLWACIGIWLFGRRRRRAVATRVMGEAE